MSKFIEIGTYGIPIKQKDENGRLKVLANALGVSYLPNYESKIVINFQKHAEIICSDEGICSLSLNLETAKMFGDVLRNMTNHLEGKIKLAKQGLLKDECYYNDEDDEDMTF